MPIRWTSEQRSDTLTLSWEEFNEKYPDLQLTRDAWRRKRSHMRNIETMVDELEDDTSEAVVFTTAPTQDLPLHETREDGKIFINRESRTIVTYLGPEFGNAVISFDTHAAMRRRYSDVWENDPETIPEIARDFDMHPKAFERYKSLHGWTHASDPFTDEEWQEGLTVDDAVAMTLESHRRAFHRKIEREKWQNTIQDAEKWRRFDQTALRPVVEAVAAHISEYQRPTLVLKEAASAYDLVFVPTDLHFGSRGWEDDEGNRYNKDEAKRLLLTRTAKILENALKFGRPTKIITAVGSDFFHVDNYGGTTTAGTPQDLDASPHKVVWDGIELAITQLELLREVAPLEIHYMAGNHDRILGYALLAAVKAFFHKDPNVQISENPNPRQYVVSGDTLIGFTHGDGPKTKDLPLLMATEASKLWGNTKHRAWFTGHYHFEHVRDYSGVVVYQMPSLAGTDRWHNASGYVGSRRGAAAYVIDATEGVVATIMVPA